MASVRDWADGIGADYRFYGDELFERVPDWYLEKTKNRIVVATDLARLVLAKELLKEGYDRVVWCDADLLVFAPQDLSLTVNEEYAFGREVWVQLDAKGRLKSYRKVHNAYFVFTQANSFLDFYIQSCLSIIRRIEGEMVPQIVGPKLLSTLHNIVEFPVVEDVGMFSPLVLRDLLEDTSDAITLMQAETRADIVAANLCSSMEGTQSDGVCLTAADMEQACSILLANGAMKWTG